MRGLIAYSFGLTLDEPNRCNARLAREVERILQEEKGQAIVVSQWEIAKALRASSVKVIAASRNPGDYLSSEEVTDQAADIFRRCGVTEVIPVAQPFLHLAKCRRLVERAGFHLVNRRVGWIGFCPESFQWYTRGPFQTLLYAALQFFTGRRGR